MRLRLYIGIAIAAAGLNAHAANPPTATGPATGSVPAAPHSRPYSVKCAATVQIWVEVDDSSLPARVDAKGESRKRVQLKLVGSAPSRGESVVCSYASRSRDVTTFYYVRCVDPRKERGAWHTFMCR